MPFRSTGFTCGVICRNDGTLSSGAMITVPASCLRVDPADRAAACATIEVYSVPWLPGDERDGRAGLRAANDGDRHFSAESEPAGTAITP